MKVLVTAGNTMTMIDKVRAITNIFRGRTGNMIARELQRLGHSVTLLTSSPNPHDIYVGEDLVRIGETAGGDLSAIPYKTYEELLVKMEYAVKNGGFDLIIHSAAVSDYRFKQVHVLASDPDGANHLLEVFSNAVLIEPIPAKGKTSSSHKRLFLELVPTEKIIDKIRRDWGYRGYLVKFKLQVDITDGELVEIACNSRAQSDADLIVANCLEWATDRAYVIGRDDVAHSVTRTEIAQAIVWRMQ